MWYENPSFSAIIVALITVIGAELLKNHFSGKKLRVDESTSIRQDMRAEIQELRKKIDQVERELDDWKGKYYSMVAENNDLRSHNKELESEVEDMRRDLKIVKDTAAKLEKRVDDKKDKTN